MQCQMSSKAVSQVFMEFNNSIIREYIFIIVFGWMSGLSLVRTQFYINVVN